MRDTRIFTTAMAAALASILGLGAGHAAELGSRPEAFQAQPRGGALPLWLVRHKLRQRGYQNIRRVEAEPDGFAVLAEDSWGRAVRLFVDAQTGAVVPRAGYGLAHLKPRDLPGHLERLGYRFVAPIAYREGRFEVAALDAAGSERVLQIDALTGAAWF